MKTEYFLFSKVKLDRYECEESDIVELVQDNQAELVVFFDYTRIADALYMFSQNNYKDYWVLSEEEYNKYIQLCS